LAVLLVVGVDGTAGSHVVGVNDYLPCTKSGEEALRAVIRSAASTAPSRNAPVGGGAR
jgi:hypothetical protein